MLPRLLSIILQSISFFSRPQFKKLCYRKVCKSTCIGITRGLSMVGHDNLDSKVKKTATFRLCKVSSYTTELLEIVSDNPTLQVVFIPGNPGVVNFYKDFLESLYDSLGGTASITAVGHLSHTKKNWGRGKLFSFLQQIDHKVDFIKQELQNNDVPIVVVGHSIGAYISIETLKKLAEKVAYCVCLYPFLKVNPSSKRQVSIKRITRSSILSSLFSFTVATLGLLPKCSRRLLVIQYMGQNWSSTAIDTASTHLLKYHMFRNMLYMAETQSKKLSEDLDWEFMRQNRVKLAFLYGTNDHWGPLKMYEELVKQVPEMDISVEREGLQHNFCCTEAGSAWVARHVANLIKNRISSLC